MSRHAISDLDPLLEDVSVRRHEGRFPVQLEVPAGSGLSETDIQNILSLASWEGRDMPCVVPGGRGVHIVRETPVYHQGIPFKGLQVNGIGTTSMTVADKGLILIDKDGFSPPDSRDFMSMVPDGMMMTSYAERGEIRDSVPGYRPFGTYSATELEVTVKNSAMAARLPIKSMVIPRIAAYGRYLNDQYRADDGRFGFVVFPIPTATFSRMATGLIRVLNEAGTAEERQECVKRRLPVLANMAAGLRELHDVGYAHMQPHLSNVYDYAGLPIMMDWTTLRKLDGTHEDNLLNRAIDLAVPMQSLEVVLGNFGFEDAPAISWTLTGMLLSVYTGSEDVDMWSVIKRTHKRYGTDASQVFYIAEALCQRGF